ncbi:hypothetical protein [Patulibacter americanus]|uniref:hypothetical protein n=1 Tax=Patulibacter americanus TaxID=588672 RepID=UPI0003B79EC2|nr:hypothetical protein [Patulibacter americanus]
MAFLRRRPPLPLRRALVVAGAIALTGCAGGGADDDPDTAQRRVVTTDAGTIIIRTVTDREGLEVEVQESSVYVRPTKDTPRALLAEASGKPLGGRCRTRDGRTVGTIALYWRERSKDWGASLDVQGVYEDPKPFAEVVRSCELRRGVAAGGGTDVNAGPVLATGVFVTD